MAETTRPGRTEQMFRLIEEQKASGMTKKSFCASQNLAINNFYYWQNKYREQSGDTPQGFIRLTARKGQRSSELLAPIVLQYPNGVSLQLPGGTPITTLRTLLSLV